MNKPITLTTFQLFYLMGMLKLQDERLEYTDQEDVDEMKLIHRLMDKIEEAGKDDRLDNDTDDNEPNS